MSNSAQEPKPGGGVEATPTSSSPRRLSMEGGSGMLQLLAAATEQADSENANTDTDNDRDNDNNNDNDDSNSNHNHDNADESNHPPDGYCALMRLCWSTVPSQRPTFAVTLAHLEHMRTEKDTTL
eukprot:m.134421 g.134421  ORF g.134421 m.134421 type:complete len:125 (-) comp29739_c0_seq3:176-550(-)